jgi:hypothetical protein
MGELKKKDYEDLLEPMQEELTCMARWVAKTARARAGDLRRARHRG